MTSETLTWLGVAFCITQSATLSGLNLAVFSLSRLHLETAAESGDADAVRVLALRRNANLTLVTILWGNVGVNVLLTLLADSLLAGVAAFFFSTVVITFAGEILPQAYFSRNALWVAARLSPLLRLYRVVLWPIAWPVGKLLDFWIGPEGIPWLRESELGDLLRHHAQSEDTEIGELEATGAINFLRLDDLPVGAEGEPLHPESIVPLPFQGGVPVFPSFQRSPEDPFLARLETPGKKWVVIADEAGRARFVLNAHEFLRDALFAGEDFDPVAACHRPLIVEDRKRPLGRVLNRLTVQAEGPGDDVIDEDLILVWTPTEKRIITGADILGRLLRGITRVTAAAAASNSAR
jgi:metal transporter CNNM